MAKAQSGAGGADALRKAQVVELKAADAPKRDQLRSLADWVELAQDETGEYQLPAQLQVLAILRLVAELNAQPGPGLASPHVLDLPVLAALRVMPTSGGIIFNFDQGQGLNTLKGLVGLLKPHYSRVRRCRCGKLFVAADRAARRVCCSDTCYQRLWWYADHTERERQRKLEDYRKNRRNNRKAKRVREELRREVERKRARADKVKLSVVRHSGSGSSVPRSAQVRS